ncbi:Gag polyprotein, partial [Heterocephalus glaber]
GLTDSTVLLLRATGPPGEYGNQPLQYWPFATSDLYNWRTQHAKFSDNLRYLIQLLETVLFTHQPTWDDCQQLLQILFTVEECKRIQNEARKLVPGDSGQPTLNVDTINTSFPLSQPDWDFNMAEEVFPTKHETAQVVAKKLLEDILPRYGFPAMLESDNGPAFISKRNLEPRWKGPYVIVLTTPTTLKADEIASWIHYTHARPADP